MVKETDATLTGADKQEEPAKLTTEALAALQAETYAARNAGIERVLESRGKLLQQDMSDEQAPAPAAEPAPVAAKPAELDPTAQLAAQIDAGGDIILDAEQLARVKFRTKVEGVEELVPGTKVVSRYQKDAAADVRLARASEKEKAADEKLAAADAKLADANNAKNQKQAEADAAKARESLVDQQAKYTAALYEGNQEEASRLLGEIVRSEVQASLPARSEAATPAAPVSVADVTNQVVQQIAVKSALEELFTSYPEIKSDPDFTDLADKYLARHEADGLDRVSAIKKTGDELGQKYRLGKYKGDVKDPESTDAAVNKPSPTTRDAKRAAKEGMDTIPAADVRSSSTAPPPETRSDIIRKMAEQRGSGRPL